MIVGGMKILYITGLFGLSTILICSGLAIFLAGVVARIRNKPRRWPLVKIGAITFVLGMIASIVIGLIMRG
jgi:cytochrome c oxidase assembly factor CtaG